MKIDQQYLKELLEAFEASPNPTTNIDELKERGIDHLQPEFLFHMRILADQGFITPQKFGYTEFRNGCHWNAVQLRLTAQGHEFAEILRNEEVFAKLQKGLKDGSIETLFSMGKQLLKAAIKQQVKRLELEDW